MNQSIANIDFVGLRIGHINFSSRLEVDDDIFVGVQRTPQSGQQVLATFHQAGSNFAKTILEESLAKPIWLTSDASPPRDRLLVNVINVKISVGGFCGL